MDARGIFLAIVVLSGKVCNVKAESGTSFQIDANFTDTLCSADTEIHGQVSSVLFCALKCSGIKACKGLFYNINTRACSTVKNVPQTGNDCETETGSVYYMNAAVSSDIKSCGDPPELANGIVLPGSVHEGSVRPFVCSPNYSVKLNGVVSVGSMSSRITCEGVWSSVECVLACETSANLVTGIYGISNDKITVTSASSSVHGPANSTLDNNEAWIPDTDDQQQYIQYEFADSRIVNEVITQGSSKHIHWTTSYKIRFSTDCVSFTEYETVFNGNNDSNGKVSNVINPAILAKCLRVNPQTWYEHIGMRVELKGC